MNKPRLSFSQIINMNFGFLGLQYSFGLQQANMSPIYSYLGADEANLPYLWLAGPMTGLIVQPIIGEMSDKTISKWGRRTPFFMVGAIVCSICLFIMPFSSSVWMAASVLWILDAANNITQEPYRAFVSDKLDSSQHSEGFLTQSAFTGLGQTLSYLTPTILLFLGVNIASKNASGIPYTTFIAFIIGSVISISSIGWSLFTTKEIPLSEEEIKKIRQQNEAHTNSNFFEKIKNSLLFFRELIIEMPKTMKQMMVMMFFSWYAMFIFWQFMVKTISETLFNTTDSQSPFFREADLLWGQMGAFYNCITFFSAFLLIFLAKKFGAKPVHSFCLFLAGIGLLLIPSIKDKTLMFVPMIGMGISWASMMGNPYIMLAGCIPNERTGVYMGVFNMFIVIPMLIQTITFPTIYKYFHLTASSAIEWAGIMLCLGGASVYFIKNPSRL